MDFMNFLEDIEYGWMDIENNIINALKAVKTCGKLENGNLALYANGNQIMELKN